MNIILSIHPKWAKLIYEGKKTLELRKNIPMNTVNIVYLYETAPICKVTGFFKYFAYTRILSQIKVAYRLKTLKTISENPKKYLDGFVTPDIKAINLHIR